jgi:hypothetical protein
MRSCRIADGQAHFAKGLNIGAFYEVLAEVVAARQTTWRLVGLETGVPKATLVRMARGGCPDGPSLAALSAWAGLNPADFVVTAENGQPSHLLSAISSVLNADPDLEPTAARDLEAIVYVTYTGFMQHHS